VLLSVPLPSLKAKNYLFSIHPCPALHYIIMPGCMGVLGIKFVSYSSLNLIFMTNSPREEVMSAVRSKKPTAKIKSLESYCTNICAILTTKNPACKYCRIQVEKA